MVSKTERGNSGGVSSNASAMTLVNAAFLAEIKDSNLQYEQQRMVLHRLVHPQNPDGSDGPPSSHPGLDDSATHCRKLCQAIREFRDAAASHFALEDAYGYVRGVSTGGLWFSDRDRLDSDDAERLVDEHPIIYLRCGDLEERFEELLYRGVRALAVLECMEEVALFLKRIETHERLERELVCRRMSVPSKPR
ncbi:MAG: hypothetical protein AAF664_12675 [Planctomycetota bacterium]